MKYKRLYLTILIPTFYLLNVQLTSQLFSSLTVSIVYGVTQSASKPLQNTSKCVLIDSPLPPSSRANVLHI